MRRYIFRNKIICIPTYFFDSLLGITMLLPAIYLAQIIDTITVGQNILLEDFYKMVFIVMGLCFIYVLNKGLGLYFRTLHEVDFVKTVRMDLAKKLLNKNIEVSKIQNMFGKEIQYIYNFYINSISKLGYLAVSFIFNIYIGGSISYEIILFIIVISLLSLYLNKHISKNLSYKLIKTQEAEANTIAYLNGFFKNPDTINVFNSFDLVTNKLVERFENKGKVVEGLYKEEAKVRSINQTVASSIQLISVGAGIYLLFLGEITLGEVTLLSFVANNIIRPLTSVTREINSIKTTKGIRDRLDDILLSEDETKMEIKFNNIVFENVNFSYDEKPFMTDIKFTLEKGKKYLIIGESGSGKSTIINLLLRKYIPTSGKILLDDKNLKDVNLPTLYEHISYASQSVELLVGTMKENILLDKVYDEEVFNRIMSGLNIEYLKDKLDIELTESIDNFSGGELQRIAIARMLYDDSDIFIFDEFTSALDNKNAHMIEKEVLKIENKTVISVSHRLQEDIMEKYDSVIVLEKGCIKAMGSYDVIKSYIKEVAE